MNKEAIWAILVIWSFMISSSSACKAFWATKEDAKYGFAFGFWLFCTIAAGAVICAKVGSGILT